MMGTPSWAEMKTLLQALLRVVCEIAKTAAHPEQSNRMVVSLYAVLLCEVLVAAPQVRLPRAPSCLSF